MADTPSDRPLRIAIFSDSYVPIVNGVSISIESLVDELRERGHSVHIFTTSFRGHKDKDPNIHRFLSIRLPWAPGYPLAIPPFYPWIRSFRSQRFDIVHTHTPFTVGFVGLRWAESHEIPIVSTYHTLYQRYVHYVPFVPRAYLLYRIAKHTNYYYNRCRHVIAPSEAAMRSLQRHGVRSPISVIPTGTPKPRSLTRDQARDQLGIRDHEKILLYVGRIAPEKNIGLLLEAVALIQKERQDVRLWLVGDGPARKPLQEYARKIGVGDRVRFVGAVPRKEVDLYYIAADLFVFSSMTETQGLVIGEAMSYGLPAVAVDGGGAGENIEPDVNGYLVGNSPKQFSETVLDVIGNPALLGRLSEGARRSVKRWTVEDYCEAVLDVYREVLGNGVTHAQSQPSHSRAD
ncbi:MAG: glycosyltransferase family 4 protein [Armatimonadetes bacterium]|nr:MAG: glycosyltransferase family 4 protein [Armatimonadota bacterium]